jgi:hypothetical protein
MNRATHWTAAFLAAAVILIGAAVSAQNAPYVGAYEADNFFSTINSNEMAVLRTKKILFASRSSGLNITDGLTRLKNKNAMHNLMNSYVRYDVYDAGGDLTIIPTNVYSSYNFVHFLCSLYPLTKRLEEIETLLRQPLHSFGNQVDVVMVHHAATEVSVFEPYTNSFDTLQAEFPNIKFIYITGGLGGVANTNSAEFSRLVRARYKGNAPLYDVGYLVSDDGACGDQYCPGYSSDGLHANSEFIEERLGKAFLLILRDIYFGSACTSSVPPTVPGNLSGTALSDNSIRLTWDPSTHGECGVARYDLTRNGSTLVSLTKTNYTDTGLTENTAYQYAIRAVSVADIASAYSSTTTVSTLVDSTAPTVTWVKAVSGPQVTIQFSENMDPVSCAIATNYSINYGVTVLSAAPSGKTVTLTTSGMANGTNYTLTLSHVADASSATNPVAPGTQAFFTYLSSAYPENPAAYWPMNGSLNDISGNGLHGAWIGDPSYKIALLGQGMALSGGPSSTTNGTYMKVLHNSLLDGMPQISISVWARKNNAATGGELFKKHVVYNMEVSASGIAGYIYNSDTGKVNFSVANLTGLNNTDWHHYALVYNGTNVFTYVDGVRRSSNGLTGTVKSSSSVHLYVGREATTSPYNTFAGDIDEMKLFRRALSTNEIAALFANGIAGHADQLAVRAILDANNLTNRLVDAASVSLNDRTTELYLQEAGVTHLTADIGQLSELTLLHCYGDRALGHPLLTQVAPEIGSCAKLTELLLFQNSLTNLPPAITNLTKLTTFSIGDNLLCGSYPWENWADTYDSDWRATQDCRPRIYSYLTGAGSVFPTNALAVSAGASTQLVYSANAWHEITDFIGNGMSVSAAISRPAYTAVYENVSADITNEVTFAVTRAGADGETPATWYGPLNANPAVADEDHDSLSLVQEYLINSHPAQSNAFQVISAGLDSERRISLSWRGLGLPNGQIEIGLQPDLNGAFTYPAGTAVYSNGVCTWRSDLTLTNRTGFVRLRINSSP